MKLKSFKLLFVLTIVMPTATSMIITSVYAGNKKFKTYSFDSGLLPAIVKESPHKFHLTFRTSKYFKLPEFKIEGNLPLKAPTIVKEKEYPGAGQINFEPGSGQVNLHIEKPSDGHNYGDNIGAYSGSNGNIMTTLNVEEQPMQPIMPQNFDVILPEHMHDYQPTRVKRMSNNWQYQPHSTNGQIFSMPPEISSNHFANQRIPPPYAHVHHQPHNQPNFAHQFANQGNSQFTNNANVQNYDHNNQQQYAKVFMPTNSANSEWTPITEGHQNYIPPNAYSSNINNRPYNAEQSYSDNTYESSNTSPRKVNIGEHYNPSESYQNEKIVEYEDSNEPDEGSVSFSFSGPHGGEKVPKGYAEKFKAQTEYLKKHFPDRAPHGISIPSLYRYYNQFTFTDQLKDNYGYDVLKIGPFSKIKQKILSII